MPKRDRAEDEVEVDSVDPDEDEFDEEEEFEEEEDEEEEVEDQEMDFDVNEMQEFDKDGVSEMLLDFIPNTMPEDNDAIAAEMQCHKFTSIIKAYGDDPDDEDAQKEVHGYVSLIEVGTGAAKPLCEILVKAEQQAKTSVNYFLSCIAAGTPLYFLINHRRLYIPDYMAPHLLVQLFQELAENESVDISKCRFLLLATVTADPPTFWDLDDEKQKAKKPEIGPPKKKKKAKHMQKQQEAEPETKSSSSTKTPTKAVQMKPLNFQNADDLVDDNFIRQEEVIFWLHRDKSAPFTCIPSVPLNDTATGMVPFVVNGDQLPRILEEVKTMDAYFLTAN